MDNLYKLPLIIFFTLLPFSMDAYFINISLHFPFVWSLLLIPFIIIMGSYPSWLLVFCYIVISEGMKIGWELSNGHWISSQDYTYWLVSAVVNWTILLTFASYAMKHKKLLNEVRAISLTDPLTGLYNRRYFDQFLESSLPREGRTTHFTLVMLDVDYFKRVNDTYGHICGDEALKHIAKVIKRNIRAQDTVVRIGGEEFALILPDTRLTEGERIAKRVRAFVQNSTFYYAGIRLPLTISLGVVPYRGQSIGSLIEAADAAMYQAKENGRNRVVVHYT